MMVYQLLESHVVTILEDANASAIHLSGRIYVVRPQFARCENSMCIVYKHPFSNFTEGHKQTNSQTVYYKQTPSDLGMIGNIHRRSKGKW
jgi:hypothetical protein